MSLAVRGKRDVLLGSVVLLLGSVVLLLALVSSRAAEPGKDPNSLIRMAVQTELAAARDDHSQWHYRDEERDAGRAAIVVETDFGSVKRVIQRNGKPLSATEAKEEDERIERLIHDPAKLAKQKKDGEQDDKDAASLLGILPTAFTWTFEGEDKTAAVLHFEPNPNFHPPTLQSRVLATMNGTVVVDKAQHRIKTISGKLTEDVTFGFGIFGRLKQGGTFRVERRELAPGLWQIVETHVHIDGRALLFKSIGEQQDEVQTSFTPVPHGTTLEQAAAISREGR